MASIIIMVGRQEWDFWPLGRRTTIIGRDEALLVQILDDLVSRKHLKIRYNEDTNTYYASEMHSRNGVFINNEKIAGEHMLTDGDVISIGGTALLFAKEDFDNRESALAHYKKAGERIRMTLYQPNSPP
ncbi:MAG: FHA domain-containing protein [Sedimentisphaerales bacterium]|nr:FHA domain-containing protein [Sedimentisphaerales bacterium]